MQINCADSALPYQSLSIVQKLHFTVSTQFWNFETPLWNSQVKNLKMHYTNI